MFVPTGILIVAVVVLLVLAKEHDDRGDEYGSTDDWGPE